MQKPAYRPPEDLTLALRFEALLQNTRLSDCLLGFEPETRFIEQDSLDQTSSDPRTLFLKCLYPLVLRGQTKLPEAIKSTLLACLNDGQSRAIQQAVRIICEERRIAQEWDPKTLPFVLAFPIEDVREAIDSHKSQLQVTYRNSASPNNVYSELMQQLEAALPTKAALAREQKAQSQCDAEPQIHSLPKYARYDERAQAGYEFDCILGLREEDRITKARLNPHGVSDAETLYLSCFYPRFLSGDTGLPARIQAAYERLLRLQMSFALYQATALYCVQLRLHRLNAPGFCPFFVDFDLQALLKTLEKQKDTLAKTHRPDCKTSIAAEIAQLLKTEAQIEPEFLKAEAQKAKSAQKKAKSAQAQSNLPPWLAKTVQFLKDLSDDDDKTQAQPESPSETEDETAAKPESMLEKMASFVKNWITLPDDAPSDSQSDSPKPSSSDTVSETLKSVAEWLKDAAKSTDEDEKDEAPSEKAPVETEDTADHEEKLERLTEMFRARMAASGSEVETTKAPKDTDAKSQKNASPAGETTDDRAHYDDVEQGFKAIFSFLEQSAQNDTEPPKGHSPIILFAKGDKKAAQPSPATQVPSPPESVAQADASEEPPAQDSSAIRALFQNRAPTPSVPSDTPSAQDSSAIRALFQNRAPTPSVHSDTSPAQDSSAIRALFQNRAPTPSVPSDTPTQVVPPNSLREKALQPLIFRENPLELYKRALREGREFDVLLGINPQYRITAENGHCHKLTDVFLLYCRCFYPLFLEGDHELPQRINRMFLRCLVKGKPVEIYQATELYAVQKFNQSHEGNNSIPFIIDFSRARLQQAIDFHREALQEEQHPELNDNYDNLIRKHLAQIDKNKP